MKLRLCETNFLICGKLNWTLCLLTPFCCFNTFILLLFHYNSLSYSVIMFTTPIDIPISPVKIDHKSNMLMLGSCFSENMGKKLQNAFFQVDINPFGVLYNPFSIRNSINYLIENKEFTRNDVFRYGSLWHSFSHDSSFSDINQDECLRKINLRLSQATDLLHTTDFLFITFGTAWIFESLKSNKPVANCHKLPAKEFRRRRLSVEEIVSEYQQLIGRLQTVAPHLNIIFSVSPIRHWKDGVHENTISKSTLLLTVEQLEKTLPNAFYFPAYEIMMDELRDYRFYAADMFHPSETAVDYIWQRFSDTYFSSETQVLKKRLEQLSTDMAHRPLHPETEEYKAFLKNVEQRKTGVITDFPFLEDRGILKTIRTYS